MPSTQHPQDDLLIVEALTELGEVLHDDNPLRAAYARRLARAIAADHGLDVGDALFQIDQNYLGTRYPSNRNPPTDSISRDSVDE
jgi:hypothetical protein